MNEYCENGFAIGPESKKWLIENISDFMLISGRIKANSVVYSDGVLFKNKNDAALFRLTWK